MFVNAVRTLAAAFLVIAAAGCEKRNLETGALIDPPVLSDEQVARIASQKVFFGHQSVGNNIVQGIRELASSDPRLKINIVKSADPQSVTMPAFVEFEIGQNGDPQSKDDSFDRILAKGMGAQGGIAMYKYCYVDFDAGTDVGRMFEKYRAEIGALKAKYPALQIVHITVPLTIAELAPKAWIKSVLGKTTSQDLDVKRNQFNRLLRQTYADSDPIFDLAKVESTHRDGSRSYFTRGGEIIYTLAAEYASDGGHLNEAGRRAAAAELLQVLSKR